MSHDTNSFRNCVVECDCHKTYLANPKRYIIIETNTQVQIISSQINNSQ